MTATCKSCGAIYENRSGRSGFCGACQMKRNAENKHKHYEKRKMTNDLTKQLLMVETHKCAICGRKFQSRSAWKEICPVCEAKMTHKDDVKRSIQYQKENWDRISFKLYKGERDKLRNYIEGKGFSSVVEIINFGLALSELYLDNKLSDTSKAEIENALLAYQSNEDSLFPSSVGKSAKETISNLNRAATDEVKVTIDD